MKAQFESLNSEKFGKMKLSNEMLRMVNGGKTYGTTESGGSRDSVTYNCCGDNGELYDGTWTFADGTTGFKKSTTLLPNTVASDYE